MCQTCLVKEQRDNYQNKRVIRDELKKLIREKSFNEIAKMFNITSGNSVKKWCKYYKLPYRKMDIKKYSDADWENENWNLNDLEEYTTEKHKKIKPSYEQFIIEFYNLSKSELVKKYDYTHIREINKIAKEYNIPCNSIIIRKFTYEEWISEKWKDSNFVNNILPNRFDSHVPEFNILKEEVYKTNLTATSKKYNVDDSTITHALKYFGLPYHSLEIKSYSYEEWMAFSNKQLEK